MSFNKYTITLAPNTAVPIANPIKIAHVKINLSLYTFAPLSIFEIF